MCVICVSKKGVRQPSKEEITNMFVNNSDGAGLMFARNGKVFINKGFASLDDYLRLIDNYHFTEDDVVIYHFRISTQARQLTMTHPFPITSNEKYLKAFDIECILGCAHNGIISLTSTGDFNLSDTALYIRDYLTERITTQNVIHDKSFLKQIELETKSKWAFLNSKGEVETIGDFITTKDGLMFSNSSYQARRVRYYGLNPIYEQATYKKVKELYVSVLEIDSKKRTCEWSYLDKGLFMTSKKVNLKSLLFTTIMTEDEVIEEMKDYLFYFGYSRARVEIIWNDLTKSTRMFTM